MALDDHFILFPFFLLSFPLSFLGQCKEFLAASNKKGLYFVPLGVTEEQPVCLVSL